MDIIFQHLKGALAAQGYARCEAVWRLSAQDGAQVAFSGLILNPEGLFARVGAGPVVRETIKLLARKGVEWSVERSVPWNLDPLLMDVYPSLEWLGGLRRERPELTPMVEEFRLLVQADVREVAEMLAREVEHIAGQYPRYGKTVEKAVIDGYDVEIVELPITAGGRFPPAGWSAQDVQVFMDDLMADRIRVADVEVRAGRGGIQLAAQRADSAIVDPGDSPGLVAGRPLVAAVLARAKAVATQICDARI